jgi:hypothetical protein
MLDPASGAASPVSTKPARIFMPLRHFASVLSAAVLLLLCTAGSAAADSSVSSNWAGYVAHGSGINFRQVTGTWREPASDCTQTAPGYSAAWVGLGGYSQTSKALEQIGTDSDCSRGGHSELSVWYELVPAPSESIHMTVRPGNLMRATVRVVGDSARLMIADLSTHASFNRVFHVSPVDISSAEWIVEAPSACTTDNNCQTLPLADFRQVRWSGAAAKTVAGGTGTITSSRWSTTSISLAADGRTYYSSDQSQPADEAAPTALRAGGSVFSVNWQQTQSTQAQPGGSGWGASDRAGANKVLQPGGRRAHA